MKLFDAHCHVQFSQFDTDRDAVLTRMREQNMGAIVVGTDMALSAAAVALAAQQDFLWASVGLHPNDNPEEEFDMEGFRSLAEHPKVVAIGECGLDYFRSAKTQEERALQQERFAQHVALAVSLRKPLIIHCREAHEDMLMLLTKYKELHGDALQIVMHFFTGSGALAQQYLALGSYLSFPGPITYTDMYDDSIRVAPLAAILTETDTPFAAPVPYRGKRNEPVYVAHVLEKIANIKGIPLAELGEQVAANAQKAFSLRS